MIISGKKIEKKEKWKVFPVRKIHFRFKKAVCDCMSSNTKYAAL